MLPGRRSVASVVVRVLAAIAVAGSFAGTLAGQAAGGHALLSVVEIADGVLRAELSASVRPGVVSTLEIVPPGECRVTAAPSRSGWPGGETAVREFTCPPGSPVGSFSIEGIEAPDVRILAEFRMLDGRVATSLLEEGSRTITAPKAETAGAVAVSAFRAGVVRFVTLPELWLLVLVATLLYPRALKDGFRAAIAFGLAAFGAQLMAFRDELALPMAGASLLVLLAALLPAYDLARERSAPRSFFAPAWLLAGLLGAALGAALTPPKVGFSTLEVAVTPVAMGAAATLSFLAIGGAAALLVTAAFRRPGDRVARRLGGLVILAAVIALIIPSATRLATEHIATGGSSAPLELFVAAAALGFALPGFGIEVRRFPVAAFVLAFSLGTGLNPEFVGVEWARIAALGSVLVLAARMIGGEPLRARWAVLLMVFVALAFGVWLRAVMSATLAFLVPQLAGFAVVSAAIVFAGLVIAESFPPDRRRTAARVVGLVLATVAVTARAWEYVLGASADLGSIASRQSLPIPVLAITLLAAAAFIRPRRRRIADALGLAAPRHRWHLVALVAAFLLLPVANLRVASPFAAGAGPDDMDTAGLVSEILTNTYQAFNLRDESELYDRLAESVTGDLVANLYLDSRRRLSAGIVDGDEVTIGEVAVLELGDAEISSNAAAGEGAMAYTARWSVAARVRHLEHVHHRQNLYSGLLRLRMDEGRWKLAEVTLTGEDRIITATGVP